MRDTFNRLEQYNTQKNKICMSGDFKLLNGRVQFIMITNKDIKFQPGVSRVLPASYLLETADRTMCTKNKRVKCDF